MDEIRKITTELAKIEEGKVKAFSEGDKVYLMIQDAPAELRRLADALEKIDVREIKALVAYAKPGAPPSVAEKKLSARTKIPAPEMPQIRVDPAVAANSLRVIEATQAPDDVNAASSTPGAAPTAGAVATNGAPARGRRGLNQAAINAALAVPPNERVAKLFEGVLMVRGRPA